VMDVKLMKRSLRLGVIVMFIGAFVIWVVEGKEHAEVGSVAEGLWWSFTTVVTGGFGDIYNPETATGRFLTILLVVTGMILVGVFTATLTSLYVGDDSEEITILQNRMDEKMDQLNTKLDRLIGNWDGAGRKGHSVPESDGASESDDGSEGDGPTPQP